MAVLGCIYFLLWNIGVSNPYYCDTFISMYVFAQVYYVFMHSYLLIYYICMLMCIYISLLAFSTILLSFVMKMLDQKLGTFTFLKKLLASINHTKGFHLDTSYKHTMYFDQIHPSILLFLFFTSLAPLPSFLNSFSGFHYAIFIHMYNVLLSYSLPLPCPVPFSIPLVPSQTVPLLQSCHIFIFRFIFCI
jgi:hypothetical protein